MCTPNASVPCPAAPAVDPVSVPAPVGYIPACHACQETADDATACPRCEVCCCDCPTCPECDKRPESDPCGECDRCEDCCECPTCEDCDRRVAETCDRCDRCGSCCECETCGRSWCGTRVDRENYCSDCDRCRGCCECIHCQDCGENCTDDYCSECDRCGSCCDGCGSGDGFRHPPHHTPRFHPARKGDALRRCVSVEVEVAETPGDTGPLRHWCRKWGAGAVEDGSLPDAGCELNTAPAAGSAFREQVAELASALADAGATVNSECGLHVHVDARDFSHYELRRLVRLYGLIEDGVYSVVPPSRRQSSYCRKSAACQVARIVAGRPSRADRRAVRKAVATAVYGTPDTRDRKRCKYDSARYDGLNLHSWFYRGTVEIRVHSGTTDRDKITHWGELWAAVVSAAARLTDKQVDQLAERHGAGPLGILTGDASFTALCELAPSDDCRAYLAGRRAKFAN